VELVAWAKQVILQVLRFITPVVAVAARGIIKEELKVEVLVVMVELLWMELMVAAAAAVETVLIVKVVTEDLAL
jgi:hypothetical protein